MKKILSIIAIIAFLIPSVSMGQISTNYGGTGMNSWPITRIPFGANSFGMFNATTSSLFTYASSTSKLTVPNIDLSGTASTSILCLTSDSCRSTWPTGGSGTGNVGTSTSEVANQIAVFGSTGATPALIGGDADFLWDGAANEFTVTGTGSFSGLVALLTGAKFNGGGTAAISYGNPVLGLTSPDSISLTAGSIALNVDGTEGVYVANNQAYRAKDTGGSARDLIKLDASNIVNVGNSSSETTILGTNTRISGLSDGCLVSASTVISTQTCVTASSKWATSTGDTTAIVPAGALEVGVGTSTPYGTLAVSTAAQQSGLIPLLNVGSTTNASLFAVLGNGNVGISTATPVARLSVTNAPGITSVPILKVATTTAGNVRTDLFSITGSSAIEVGQVSRYGLPIRFWTNQNSAFYGDVGYGYDTNNGPYVGMSSSNIDVQLISGARSFWTASGGSRDAGIGMQVTTPFSAASARMLVIANRNNAASGNATGISIDSTWNTSAGTANDSDILINRTETSLSATGAHRFITGQVASSDRFWVSNLGGAFYNGNVGIGTSTPLSKLVVQGASSVGLTPALVVASSTNATVFSVSGAGHIKTGGATPTVSTCGTSPSVSGNDTAGTVTVGSGVVTECTLTFAAPRSGTPRVVGVVTGGGLNIAGGYSAKSSTAVTFSFAATVGSGTFDYYIVE